LAGSFSKSHIEVLLSAGSVVAAVSITPTPGMTATQLHTTLNTNARLNDMMSSVDSKVRTVPGLDTALAVGKTLSDIQVSSTPPTVRNPTSSTTLTTTPTQEASSTSSPTSSSTSSSTSRAATTAAGATFLPGATKVVLVFHVTGLSYSKLVKNPKIYRAVSDAIAEGIAHVASSTSAEYAGLSIEHVAVKLSVEPGQSDDIKVHAAISSPQSADAMLLWSKMVGSSFEVERTVEAKISFASGVGLVATGPVAITGGIFAFPEKDTDITTMAPIPNASMIAAVSSAHHAVSSTLLVVTISTIQVLSM